MYSERISRPKLCQHSASVHVIKHSVFSSNLSLVCFFFNQLSMLLQNHLKLFSCQTELFPPPPPPSDAPPLCPGELPSEESALPPPPPAQASFPYPVTPGQQPVYNPEVCRLILQCHYNKWHLKSSSLQLRKRGAKFPIKKNALNYFKHTSNYFVCNEGLAFHSFSTSLSQWL